MEEDNNVRYARILIAACRFDAMRDPLVRDVTNRYTQMGITSEGLRNEMQRQLEESDADGYMWHCANYTLQCIFANVSLNIPVHKKLAVSEWIAPAPSGPLREDGNNPNSMYSAGPTQAQFQSLSQRIAKLHAFVLSQR